MTRAELIQFNAAKLRDLRDAIRLTVKFRHEVNSQRERWEEAGRRFHESYDQLAFPGGLTEWLGQLEANDPAAIEDAVLFLEFDPFFFRSGYIKEFVLEHLRWASLDQDHKLRFEHVVLARIRDAKTKREFRRYCRLAPFVTDPEFSEEIAKIAVRLEQCQSGLSGSSSTSSKGFLTRRSHGHLRHPAGEGARATSITPLQFSHPPASCRSRRTLSVRRNL